ncbi:hypothetical protein AAZX31_18G136800 [Glycine max]
MRRVRNNTTDMEKDHSIGLKLNDDERMKNEGLDCLTCNYWRLRMKNWKVEIIIHMFLCFT